MNAVIYELVGPRDLRLREETLAVDVLPVDRVAAKTLVSAISPGTEVAAYVGLPPLRPMKVYPRLIGYCNIATVIAVGSDVVGIATGDVIATYQSHRSAFICPETEIVAVLPANADPITAAPSYLFQLGYSAFLRAGGRAGHNVAVIGLGSIGLGAIAVAANAGARVLGLSDQAESLALEFGAERVLPKNWDNPELKDEPDIDIVITTTNQWSDWRLALELARPYGTVAVLGFPGRGEPAPTFNPLASQFFYDKQLSILGCGLSPNIDVAAEHVRFTEKRNYNYVLERVLAGKLPARRLVSDIVSWRELETVYKRLEARDSGVLTFVLDWR